MKSPKKVKVKPYGFTLFCDDLREEVGGKTTYVGVYGDAMYVKPELPFQLPKLHLAIHIFNEPGKIFKTLKIQIAIPGDDAEKPGIEFDVDENQLIKEKTPDVADEPTQMRTHIALKLGMIPFPIKDYGRLRVSALWNGDYVSLGSLAIAPAPKSDS